MVIHSASPGYANSRSWCWVAGFVPSQYVVLVLEGSFNLSRFDLHGQSVVLTLVDALIQ